MCKPDSSRSERKGGAKRGGQECQLDLFADRTSAATMRANQLRLWFAAH